MADANALKDQGNKAFSAKDYDKAIDLFSRAIALDPKNHVLFSNRSACKAAKKQWSEALADADECIKINPSWGKGYLRRGAALHGLHQWDEAITAYEDGIKHEDSPALQKGLREVQEAQAREASSAGAGGDDGGEGIGKIFQDPKLFEKLGANPQTAPYLADQAFVQKLRALQQRPAGVDQAVTDPRMITVMGVLLGIDMRGFERPEGSTDLPEGLQEIRPEPTPPPKPTPAPAPVPSASVTEIVDDEMEEGSDDAKAKAAAELEKKNGGAAYKARNFAAAEEAYRKAWELWPKDITYLTNLAAVYFEQGEYDKAISTCEQAVEEGRSLRVDYKLIAKAYGRIGNSYSKKDDLTNAIKFFSKSLAEHRTPEILAKLNEAEKAKAESEKQSYINPELSTKAREQGNAEFKAGDFAAAVKSYTEAIKRDPTSPLAYNNRASAYTKLLAFPEALKDAEAAVKIDPKFVKGHLRKSLVLFSMKEYTKAIEACQEASAADEDGKNAREIESQIQKCAQALYAEREGETEEQTLQRAMRDPEVAQIMNDPVIQQILQQAQRDPAALRDHMKNPIVQQKINKLIAAGIIKTR